MDDFRISIGWRTHPKRTKLIRRLGRDAAMAITDLWGWCAANPSRRSGDLVGMDNEEIAIAADYPGDADEFVKALSDVRLLDGAPGSFTVHDYTDNNPHVATRVDRHDSAKSSALARWHKEGKHANAPVASCSQCEADANAYANDANASKRNAPTYLPTYLPNTGSHAEPKQLALSAEAADDPPPAAGSRGVSFQVREIFDHYRKLHPRAHRTPQPASKEWKLIQARLREGSTVEELKLAIDGCHATPWNTGENPEGKRYLDLELIMRSASNVARFLAAAESPSKPSAKASRFIDDDPDDHHPGATQ